MHFRLAVALLLALLAAAWLPGSALAAYSNHTCQNNNDCYGVSGRPVCVKPDCKDVNNAGVMGYCGQCNPCSKKEEGWEESPIQDPLHAWLFPHNHNAKDCYCEPDEYCSGAPFVSQTSKPNPNRGFCMKLDPNNQVLNKPCVANLAEEDLILGYNDRSFCGLATFELDNSVTYIEWRGHCWQQQCKFCAAAPIPGLPLTRCADGRSCLPGGVIGYAPLGVLSWPFWQSNPLIPMTGLVLLFAFLTLMSLVIYLLAWYVRHRRQEKTGYQTVHMD